MHEVSTLGTVNAMDLMKMLVLAAVVGVPHGQGIISLLNVMGIFNLLLEPELFKDLKIDEARM